MADFLKTDHLIAAAAAFVAQAAIVAFTVSLF